jgi:hypothetical protein
MEIESVSGRHCFMQVEVGLDQRICCIPAVHAPPALHSHEALRPVKVKKLVFCHQALAWCTFHDGAAFQSLPLK